MRLIHFDAGNFFRRSEKRHEFFFDFNKLMRFVGQHFAEPADGSND